MYFIISREGQTEISNELNINVYDIQSFVIISSVQMGIFIAVSSLICIETFPVWFTWRYQNLIALSLRRQRSLKYAARLFDQITWAELIHFPDQNLAQYRFRLTK